MGESCFMEKIKKWAYRNVIAIALVVLFILIYIVSLPVTDAWVTFGATGMENLNGEYFRWFTCLFFHYNLRHLLGNSAALLAVGALLSPFIGRWRTVFLFLAGGFLSELAFSIVISESIYDIGASSGIFALIACLMVCVLRYPEDFRFKWYRLEVLILVVYFVFANSSVSAFLVHAFGFAAGTVISFVMVLAGKMSKTISKGG